MTEIKTASVCVSKLNNEITLFFFHGDTEMTDFFVVLFLSMYVAILTICGVVAERCFSSFRLAACSLTVSSQSGESHYFG